MTEMGGVNKNVPLWLIKAAKRSAPVYVVLIVLGIVVPKHTAAYDLLSLVTGIAVVVGLVVTFTAVIKGDQQRKRDKAAGS